jgi:hypothetical protein
MGRPVDGRGGDEPTSIGSGRPFLSSGVTLGRPVSEHGAAELFSKLISPAKLPPAPPSDSLTRRSAEAHG